MISLLFLSSSAFRPLFLERLYLTLCKKKKKSLLINELEETTVPGTFLGLFLLFYLTGNRMRKEGRSALTSCSRDTASVNVVRALLSELLAIKPQISISI